MINTINNKKFKTANEAYEYLHDAIIQHGVEFSNTKALFNVGFYITNPLANKITNKERNWKLDYAEAEWQWYLSGNRNISELGELYGKIPEIWKRMADSEGDVNSNYGWQWNRNGQIDWVVNLLKTQPNTRQAAISIYDCKEHDKYYNDTPCTYAVQFTILHGKLDMCVTMRSNDLWYGFCNDQYCFSKLQALVAFKLDIEPGVYYHFAHNMHLYNDKI
jgi:thymidylate synthase|tara:strand:+ start:366 stop:1022 length:657 start_codon:yes stop_codon:yes gene_type:complete